MNGQDPKLTAGQPSQPKPLPVKFVHKESGGFKTIHADGIWGMLNSHRNIQINFFTERPPIPDSVIFPIQSDGISFGQMVEEYKERDDKNFIVVREFQVGAVMSLAAAKQVHTVLGNFIAVADEQERLAAQMQMKPTKTV
jgi:hypothetical protein